MMLYIPAKGLVRAVFGVLHGRIFGNNMAMTPMQQSSLCQG